MADLMEYVFLVREEEHKLDWGKILMRNNWVMCSLQSQRITARSTRKYGGDDGAMLCGGIITPIEFLPLDSARNHGILLPTVGRVPIQ